MKAIYSLWTKPYLEKPDSNFGFLSLEDFKNSFILSVNAMSMHNDNIHLYTDSKGLELFGDMIYSLPFKQVHNVLDKFENIPGLCWAFCKLHVYGLQDEPFFHIDNDAILWNSIPEDITENWDIICQNFEEYREGDLFYGYREAIKYYKNFELTHGKILSPKVLDLENYHQAPNAGIFGACNEKGLKMFKFLAQESTIVLEKLLNTPQYLSQLQEDSLDSFWPQYINMFQEQSNSWVYIKDNDIKAYSVYDDTRIKFTHLMGGRKRLSHLMDKVAERVKRKKWTA